jgi:hypothetical protein
MRKLILSLLLGLLTGCTTLPVLPSESTPTAVISTRPAPTVMAALDLTPYRAALKPEFAAEVDRFETVPQYQIDLAITPDRTSYSARQKVRYTNAENVPLREVYFRLFPNSDAYGGQLQITSLQVEGADVKPVYELADTAMKVELDQPLQPGEAIEIEMAYTVQVPTAEVQLGYNRFGLHDDVLTLPGFFPLIPVYDDEGWNVEMAPPQGDTVFSDTALFQVDITAPVDQVVVTSGVCDRAGHETLAVYHCVSGPMRDFMIVMSPDLDVKSDGVDGVTINSYARQANAKGGEQALRAAVQAVQSYNRRFGAYPFTELDVVATPTTAGGIEYPGLVVIAEGLYRDSGPVLDLVVAHEVAHQWWYSLVGNDQIDAPWLDEALAEFSPALFFRDWYGEEAIADLVKYWQASYDQVKGKPEDKRADLPVGQYSDDQYGMLVYVKAALFFNALYETLGDEKFNLFLQEYFQTYRFGVAYPKDLLAIAAKYVGQDRLDKLLREWITTP